MKTKATYIPNAIYRQEKNKPKSPNHGLSKISISIPKSKEKSSKKSTRINEKQKIFDNQIKLVNFLPEELMEETLSSLENVRREYGQSKFITDISLKYYNRVDQNREDIDTTHVEEVDNQMQEKEVVVEDEGEGSKNFIKIDNKENTIMNDQQRENSYCHNSDAINYIKSEIKYSNDPYFKESASTNDQHDEIYANRQKHAHCCHHNNNSFLKSNCSHFCCGQQSQGRMKICQEQENIYNKYKISSYPISQQGNNPSQNSIYKKNSKEIEFTLKILDLSNIISLFEIKCINFKDLLLLDKNDLVELELDLVSRNRIKNFIESYNRHCKLHLLDEILKFFMRFKAFIFNSFAFNELLQYVNRNTQHEQNSYILNINNENKEERENNNNILKNTEDNQLIITKDHNYNRPKVVEKDLVNVNLEIDSYIKQYEEDLKSNQKLNSKIGKLLSKENSNKEIAIDLKTPKINTANTHSPSNRSKKSIIRNK